ncbi:MAG TPA: MarR family transcriptional regulator [Ilumatobacter sp.]|nr:MarR family transcriptional regulator [Ilumatobacter sp.]
MNNARETSQRQTPPGGHEAARVPLTASRPELLVDGNDDQLRGLIHDLLAFGGRLRDIRDALGGLIGLSGPAYTVMIAIAHLANQGTDAPADVGVTSVARHLNVSQPFVTAEVGKLAAAGLVDKAPSRADRRSVTLTVTDRAQALLASLAPDQREINDALFDSLGVDDFHRLSAMIGELVRGADHALVLAAERAQARQIAGGAA